MFLSISPLYPRQSQPLSQSSSLDSLTPSSTLAPSSSFSDSSGTIFSSTAPSTSDAIASSTSITSFSTSITPTRSPQFLTSFPSTSSATSTVTHSPSSTPLTTPSGYSLLTLTSTYVTDIGGSPTTVVTPIITALRTSTSLRSSPRTNVIIGSAIGGLVAFILVLTSLFIMRRRVQRRRYWALARSKQYPSRVHFLAGEEMDLPQHPSPPLIYSDREPFMNRSWRNLNVSSSQSQEYSHTHSLSGSSRTQSPPLSPPPRLLRPRASESGSIFQENIWPPPSAASQLMDPLTHAAQSVDLGRIIDDVMGPERASPPEISDSGLLLTVREYGQEQEPEQPQREQEQTQEQMNEDSVVAMLPLPLTLTRTISDETPEPSASASILPQPPRWLSRSPNPSPKGSPLHKASAI